MHLRKYRHIQFVYVINIKQQKNDDHWLYNWPNEEKRMLMTFTQTHCIP